MAVSKENFVKYLEERLTPESAKSYLSYVDAFSKAVGKGEKHYFSSTKYFQEIAALLKGSINENPDFKKHSPKFQANIKTGIRALLTYYLYVDNHKKELEDKKIKIPAGLTGAKITEHYIDKFGTWLKNFHVKENGDRFRSAQNYTIGLKRALTDLNADPKEFFSYSRTFQIKVFYKQLENNKNFWDRSESVKREVKSSVNKYKFYIAEKYGERQKSLFDT